MGLPSLASVMGLYISLEEHKPEYKIFISRKRAKVGSSGAPQLLPSYPNSTIKKYYGIFKNSHLKSLIESTILFGAVSIDFSKPFEHKILQYEIWQKSAEQRSSSR